MKSLKSISSPTYVASSAWTEHVPFALWITDQIAPRILVELGTHHGMSYFAFCQAIAQARLSTRTFAVDTWKGDDHAGFYGESVYEHVSRYNEKFYNGFSTLLRMNFNEAVQRFPDGYIDLLHIDGRHGYDDVSEDFYTWLPKLSDSAVVLFHDTTVLDRGFGVHRFWSEIKSTYPSLEFRHGYGLGVLGVGSNQSVALKSLFSLTQDEDQLNSLRLVFENLGSHLLWAINSVRNADD